MTSITKVGFAIACATIQGLCSILPFLGIAAATGPIGFLQSGGIDLASSFFSKSRSCKGCHRSLQNAPPVITSPVLTPGLRANFDFANASPATQIRAIIEAQVPSIRVYSRCIGGFDALRTSLPASELSKRPHSTWARGRANRNPVASSRLRVMHQFLIPLNNLATV